MDATGLPFVLFISLLLPVGFVIGYATHSLIAVARRVSEDSMSHSIRR
jgi:hypothetical protein